LVLSAFLFNKKILYLILPLAIIALFLNGARTEFVLFLASFFMMFVIKMIYMNVEIKLLSVLKILILISIFFVIIDYIPSNRIFQLADILNSSSAIERIELLNYSINLIENSFIFGEYGGYTAKEGSLGSYPHNLFSAWVNLGLFGFLLYVGLLIFIIIQVIKNINRINILNAYYILFVLSSTSIILALLFSKEYNHMLVGFTVGVGINFFRTKRKLKYEI